MGRFRKFTSSVVLLACLSLSTGCGAGLITGIAASDSGGGGGAAPTLGLSAELPLVPAPGTTRSVLVANAPIAAAAALRIQLEAAGAGDDQLDPVASGQGGGTSITFTLNTANIRAAVGDPVVDVPATLRVFVDGRLITAPVPVKLARQPRATLLLPTGQTQLFLSPFGERIALRVDGLRSTVASNLEVLVTTRDPETAPTTANPSPELRRLATDVQFAGTSEGLPVLTALVPGNAFPLAAKVVVRDALAGESKPVENAFYRPDIALALPAQGPTTGGTLVTLIGTALAPPDFLAGQFPVPMAFDDVELSFAKGGRVTTLPRADFRTAESGADRLVFTMPQSPDGRPGQVDIVLRVRSGTQVATVVAGQQFLFANPDPFFGPRGAVLDRMPVAIAPIALDDAPGIDGAPDLAVLTEQGGVGFLQLLLAQQNGMFQAFAAPRRIGDHENAAERGPRDLCVGDFDGDQVPDVFLVNEGGVQAVHHLVLGQVAPLTPLGVVHPIGGAAGMTRGRVARLDGDTLPDIVLVPGLFAPPGTRPQVLLARPTGAGAPGFAAPVELVVRAFPYEAFEVADLDGDGNVDVALVSGTLGKLDVAYGLGNGTFSAGVPLDFTVPGYALDAESPAVGLHACRDAATQSLALVLAGKLPLGPTTPPTVTVLRVPDPLTAPRVYEPPQPIRTTALPTEPIGRSLLDDLDGVPPVEMVLAIAGDPTVIALGALRLNANGGFGALLSSIEEAIPNGPEFPRQVRALAFGRAFPASASLPGRQAVFLLHESEVDGARERRISTRLVIPSPPDLSLAPPDATTQLGFGIANLAFGDFHPTSVTSGGTVRDLAVVRLDGNGVADVVQVIENDGFGAITRASDFIAVPGVVAASLAVLPATGNVVDGLLFADRDSRIGFWRHVPTTQVPPPPPQAQTIDAWTGELRALLPAPLATTQLAATTCLRVGDVDGDGVPDLVALLTFALGVPGEGQAAIALLRGKAAYSATEFPFHVPTALTAVHGNTTAIELGDFTANGSGQPVRLELAAAVPAGTGGGIDGDHVRFFRYQPGATPADDRFVPAAAANGPQVLLAGSNPVQLAATDFDRDGLVDLLVACRGDATLRLFRNTAAVDPTASAVAVADFVEALGSPWNLAAGVPTRLRLSDVNGDGNLDAVTFVEATATGTGLLSSSCAIYLSSGGGTFDGPRFLSPTRIGNRNGHLAGELGDFNRDGVPDLFVGWDSTVQPFNLRVLFGGTR
jgi:hypothetical protein